MGDQAERVILEAEDQVTPTVDKANAGLDSFEKKAESSHGKVIRITDQTRSSVQRLIASLEKQAETYGKSGVDRLVAQRDQLLQRYSREPQAIDAITRSYEKMIAEQKKIDSEAKFEGFGEKVKQFIQNPLEGAKGVFSSVLSTMGPFGMAIASGAVALGGIAIAGFEAAKSLGQYGTMVKDAELRTGLTAQEVGQFGFAARAVGQDVSIFERMMRGLSQAADDTSKEGEKARATMQRMGVSMYDATGAMKPTSQILEEISSGLAKMPNALERDAAAMALFKRAGIEAIPVITELSGNLQIAKEQGYGPSEEEVRRFAGYQREVAEIEMSWERMKRSLQEPLVATVNFVWNGLKWAEFVATVPGKLLMQRFFSGKPTTSDTEMGETQGWGYGATMSRSAHAGEQRSIATNDAMVAAARVSDPKNKQLEIAEKKLSELQGELKTGVFPSVNEPILKQIGQQQSLIANLKAQAEATKELKEFQRSAAEFEKKGDEAELDTAGKIYYQRDQLLQQAEKVKASEAEIAAIRKSADEQVAVVFKKASEEFEKYDQKRGADLMHRMVMLQAPTKEQIQGWGEGFSAQERVEDLGVQAQREALRRHASMQAKAAETPEGTYRIRVDLAIQLAEIEVARIEKEDNAARRMTLATEAQKELYTGLAQAQDELDEKSAAAEQKRVEELQRQVDVIQKASSGLMHTLFTKPGDFPKQLGDTIREAVLKPVTEGLGGMVAQAIHPLIYGSDGRGGIAGVFQGAFGGKQDPVKVATDLNTAATMQNSGAVAALTAVLAGLMGIAAPAIAAPAGVGGLSLPSISVPAPSISVPSIPLGSADQNAGAGGIPLRGAAGGGGFNPLSMIFGGGAPAGATTPPFIAGGTTETGGSSGLSGLLQNFKSINLGGLTRTPSRWALGEDGSMTEISPGKITGVNGLLGAGLFTGGTMLAQQGLLGPWQGTWGGVAAGTLGGAAMGFQMGGPLGAAIGAGVGLGIGLGEKIAGVKSLEQTAHDDVKSVYGVDIPPNSGTIKQIVDIAKSQFGGSISVAVRSPSVRQLVMLYSEATGQKMPLSATTPYAGSLVEQGGSLYQQASFQNNAWHTYASSLPALGGIQGSTYPTPGGPNTASGMGGPTYLSINVDGQAMAPFMTGQYVTPQFVTDQAMVAQYSSYGRTQQSANMQLPGLTVA